MAGDVPPDAQEQYAAPAEAAAAGGAAAAAYAPEPQVPSDAPIHYVNCPKCATQFSAQGVKPLAIRCPSCGVRGVLR
jgi:DNA-directed RNA polymerase subunit RPC12/RpoP